MKCLQTYGRADQMDFIVVEFSLTLLSVSQVNWQDVNTKPTAEREIEIAN